MNFEPNCLTFVRCGNPFAAKQSNMHTFKKFLGFTILSTILITSCKKSDDILTNGTLLELAATPVNNAMGIIRNTEISVTFNLPMDSSTITTSTFTIQKGTKTLNGTITSKGNTFTYSPTDLLEANTLYMVTLTTGIKAATGVLQLPV